jgi:hypothetical protein
MAQYLAPGVYVEEVPSAQKPIAGVGTSTAGFIGIVPDRVQIPVPNPDYDPTRAGVGEGERRSIDATDGARELAEEAGIDLTAVDGSGGGGRIVKADVEKAIAEGAGGARPRDKDVVEPFLLRSFDVAPVGAVRLITNFSEFERHFGSFSTDTGQKTLAHAVYGFFHNGGTRCFVVRVKDTHEIAEPVLRKFEAIDEMAIVVAPGLTDPAVHDAIVTHCKNMSDRFAILDAPEDLGPERRLDLSLLDPSSSKSVVPKDSDYAAFYVPWIRVFDPATKVQDPKGEGRLYVPNSGHVAGIYARVDNTRGVHKAPANEPVQGALGLKYYVSKAQQEGLNPNGVNCIRDINGVHSVWGARTIGGDRNAEWKYVNIRRLFLFLRESIDEGTQWVVFEPNTPPLWGKIRRNVSAFLTNVWRDGALFGSTPAEAFYVKCDAETNPLEVREQGRVVTEIGVAVAHPAEFVIFRISQWSGPAA